jgi:hypothetical protein
MGPFLITTQQAYLLGGGGGVVVPFGFPHPHPMAKSFNCLLFIYKYFTITK